MGLLNFDFGENDSFSIQDIAKARMQVRSVFQTRPKSPEEVDLRFSNLSLIGSWISCVKNSLKTMQLGSISSAGW